jgi:hypothetical protein
MYNCMTVCISVCMYNCNGQYTVLSIMSIECSQVELNTILFNPALVPSTTSIGSCRCAAFTKVG